MIYNDSKFNNSWDIKSLNQLGEFRRGKSKHRPRNDKKMFNGGTYPLVQTGEITSANLYIRRHSAMYNEFGLNQSKLWSENTLCITIAANIAETALLGYPMCFPDSVVGFNAYSKESSEMFMHYVFTYIKKSIQNSASGSIQDNINIEYLTSLKFRIPKKNYQDKVVEVLSCLDSKIELNNSINAELEAMAKTLYNYWFVQFDFPNKEGKPYKWNGGKMVWNEELKREIPEGWEVNCLGDLGNFKNGVNYDPSKPGNIACPIINVRNISASSLFLKNEDLDIIYLNESDVRKYSVHNGSIIIARSGIPGATRLISDCEENTLYCGFAIHFELKNLDKILPIFFFLKSIELQIQNGSGGTILKNVNQGTLNALQIALPTDNNIQMKFNKLIEPIFSKINLIEKENQQLSTLRDWLLPMLMNGQVTVGDSAENKASYKIEEKMRMAAEPENKS